MASASGVKEFEVSPEQLLQVGAVAGRQEAAENRLRDLRVEVLRAGELLRQRHELVGGDVRLREDLGGKADRPGRGNRARQGGKDHVAAREHRRHRFLLRGAHQVAPSPPSLQHRPPPGDRPMTAARSRTVKPPVIPPPSVIPAKAGTQ